MAKTDKNAGTARSVHDEHGAYDYARDVTARMHAKFETARAQQAESEARLLVAIANLRADLVAQIDTRIERLDTKIDRKTGITLAFVAVAVAALGVAIKLLP